MHRHVRHPLAADAARGEHRLDAVAAGEMGGADGDEHGAGPRHPVVDPARPGGVAVGEHDPAHDRRAAVDPRPSPAPAASTSPLDQAVEHRRQRRRRSALSSSQAGAQARPSAAARACCRTGGSAIRTLRARRPACGARRRRGSAPSRGRWRRRGRRAARRSPTASSRRTRARTGRSRRRGCRSARSPGPAPHSPPRSAGWTRVRPL